MISVPRYNSDRVQEMADGPIAISQAQSMVLPTVDPKDGHFVHPGDITLDSLYNIFFINLYSLAKKNCCFYLKNYILPWSKEVIAGVLTYAYITLFN